MIVPAVITLGINLAIFKHVHSSSHRIQPHTTTTAGAIIVLRQSSMNRRDLYLLQHMMFMFSMFIVGWTPIFSLVAMDYNYNVSPLVYALLQVFAVISVLVCMLDLSLCNHDLRRYLKDKLLQFF